MPEPMTIRLPVAQSGERSADEQDADLRACTIEDRVIQSDVGLAKDRGNAAVALMPCHHRVVGWPGGQLRAGSARAVAAAYGGGDTRGAVEYSRGAAGNHVDVIDDRRVAIEHGDAGEQPAVLQAHLLAAFAQQVPGKAQIIVELLLLLRHSRLVGGPQRQNDDDGGTAERAEDRHEGEFGGESQPAADAQWFNPETSTKYPVRGLSAH